jgi:serine/threonine protein kinase
LLPQITDDLVFPSYVELSASAKDFLTRALRKNPAERMDLDEMLAHPFLKDRKKETQQFEFKL